MENRDFARFGMLVVKESRVPMLSRSPRLVHAGPMLLEAFSLRWFERSHSSHV